MMTHCSGLLGRTSLRQPQPGRRSSHARYCSGLLGRTSLRHNVPPLVRIPHSQLFRPSRPDFIETISGGGDDDELGHCSGLLGRTSLRLGSPEAARLEAHRPHCSGLLGRTSLRRPHAPHQRPRCHGNCSGLLGRTSLRREVRIGGEHAEARLFRPSRPDFIETIMGGADGPGVSAYCSGLLGRTSLRRMSGPGRGWGVRGLFRPSRPDFIETFPFGQAVTSVRAGLFRPSRPDFIETTSGESRQSPARFHCSGLLGRTSLRHALGPEFPCEFVAIVPAF